MASLLPGALSFIGYARRYGLAAHCWRCNRWHDFDINELVARIGNRDIVRFKPRCSKCGARGRGADTPKPPVASHGLDMGR